MPWPLKTRMSVVFPQLGVIDLPSRQINDFFTKRKQKKIESVDRPGWGDEAQVGQWTAPGLNEDFPPSQVLALDDQARPEKVCCHCLGVVRPPCQFGWLYLMLDMFHHWISDKVDLRNWDHVWKLVDQSNIKNRVRSYKGHSRQSAFAHNFVQTIFFGVAWVL